MIRGVALLLAVSAALAACGRPGPIRPPGPPSEIIFPRIYPYERPVAPPAAGVPAAVSPAPGPAITR